MVPPPRGGRRALEERPSPGGDQRHRRMGRGGVGPGRGGGRGPHAARRRVRSRLAKARRAGGSGTDPVRRPSSSGRTPPPAPPAARAVRAAHRLSRPPGRSRRTGPALLCQVSVTRRRTKPRDGLSRAPEYGKPGRVTPLCGPDRRIRVSVGAGRRPSPGVAARIWPPGDS